MARDRRAREERYQALGLTPLDAQRQASDELDRMIVRAHRCGAMYRQIGDHLGVSMERVRQMAMRGVKRPKSPLEQIMNAQEAANAMVVNCRENRHSPIAAFDAVRALAEMSDG